MEHYGGGSMTKAITGIAALAMILASPVCFMAGAVRLAVCLAIAGWAVLIGLAARMEEKQWEK